MTREILEAKVTGLYARHSPHSRYRNARVSLWANTEMGHQVWVETISVHDHGRIEDKKKGLLELSRYKVGDTLRYEYKAREGIGFIRY